MRILTVVGLIISISAPSVQAVAGVEAVDVEVVIDPGAGTIDSTATLAVTPPVQGVERNDEIASTVLYKKGPVLLAELEESIGREAFLSFLRARVEGEVDTTEGCLDPLSEVASPEARRQLESALRR